MSIGNLKDYGNKGNNFPWQLKMLMGQQCACDALQEIVDNTDTVEPLLAQILAAIQNGTDFEAALVVDANDVTWLEIRIWNGTTFDPPIYFEAGDTVPGTPVAPITYINPNTYLAQIVSNTTGLATEVTLDNIYTELQGGITVDAVDLDIRDLDCATDSVSICAGGTPLTSTAFSPTEQALDVNVLPRYIIVSLENLEVSAADGNLSSFGPNITSISFFSNGTANALVSVNGGASYVNLVPGTTINLDANSPSNAYVGTSFFWDTTTNVGSSLIIIYSYI
jgi:hypothetical protein